MSKVAEERIYEQWRKFLCVMVTNEDVSYNHTYRKSELTAEQVRTIFNFGYRLAMAQMKDSLNVEATSAESTETHEKIQKLIERTVRRENASNCLNLYKNYSMDEMMYSEAIVRKKQIDDCMLRTVCSWGDEEKM
jgi:hypothetical protein